METPAHWVSVAWVEAVRLPEVAVAAEVSMVAVVAAPTAFRVEAMAPVEAVDHLLPRWL